MKVSTAEHVGRSMAQGPGVIGSTAGAAGGVSFLRPRALATAVVSGAVALSGCGASLFDVGNDCGTYVYEEGDPIELDYWSEVQATDCIMAELEAPGGLLGRVEHTWELQQPGPHEAAWGEYRMTWTVTSDYVSITIFQE